MWRTSLFSSPNNVYLFYCFKLFIFKRTRILVYICNYMPESKKETSLTQQTLETDSNTFTLKKLINNHRISDVSVIFPLVNRLLEQKQNQEDDLNQLPKNSYPVFNNDMKYYTPCFVVDADRLKVQKNSNIYLENHQQRVNEFDEQDSQILVPKPSKNHSACSLCKISFQDYLQHVDSAPHKEKEKKSKIFQNIQGLRRLMARKDKRSLRNQKQKEKKQKPIRKERKKAVRTKQTSKQQEVKQPTQISYEELSIYLNL